MFIVIFMRTMQRFLILALFIMCLTDVPFVAGDQEYRVTSGNKTVHVFWTLDSSEDTHVLRCVGEGSPLPSLKWAYGSDREEFMGNATIHVDIQNQTEIKMSFSKIDYTIINEFYCLAYDPKNSTIIISEATFYILVGASPRSGWLVFLMLLFIAVFMVGVVGICKGLRFNYYATQIDM